MIAKRKLVRCEMCLTYTSDAITIEAPRGWLSSICRECFAKVCTANRIARDHDTWLQRRLVMQFGASL